ncbi:hypothetical protein SteCoe_25075 [Stentor coeruleus]|uniref:Myb-like DNA-binding domain containing protein n=1 Tax=Stentor coeruleus TaxID=5963 RepID=A0A1R2BG37_9CILI|nr:hypothetical protein SteCoe_25075 [Stentor coeruleus]
MVKNMAKCWNEKVLNIQEDEVLTRLVQTNGKACWKKISDLMALHNFEKRKNAKQCRNRWVNCIDPLISQKPWTPDEQLYLINLYKIIGSNWSSVSDHFEGRPPDAVKNQFYSIIKKNFRRYNKYYALGKTLKDDPFKLIQDPMYFKLLVRPTIPKGYPAYKTSQESHLQVFEDSEIETCNSDVKMGANLTLQMILKPSKIPLVLPNPFK